MLKTRLQKLLVLIFDKYIYPEFNLRKESQPDLAYSNFTKVDKNFGAIISRVYDDFAYDVNSRVAGVVDPLFYVETEAEAAETTELAAEAINHSSVNLDDTVDELAETLKEKLVEYRTQKYKERGIKAYVVFSNKELAAIVDKKPRNTSELYRFACFASKPRSKVKLDGDAICEIVKSVYGDRK